MRKIILTGIVALIAISSQAQALPISGNWEITFNDEFDGNSLNPDKWRVGQHWLGFNGMAGNSTDNIVVRDGYVEIKAEKRPMVFAGKSYNYASGEITTFKKFRQKYGYFEARIKYDAIQGSWPAFWTMPDRGLYGNADMPHQSYLKFKLKRISKPVNSAILKIKVSSLKDTSELSDVSIHRLLSNNWDEKTITWMNKPDFDPAWFNIFTGTSDTNLINEITVGEYLEIDITKYVNSQILEDKIVGFALIDMFQRKLQVQINSKEAVNISDRPYIDIEGTKIYPTDDAYVRAGSYCNDNYGNETLLIVQDSQDSIRTSFIGNNGMEIDIMESLGIWGADKTQHALHWDYYGPGHPHAGSGTLSLKPTEDGFHIYAAHWQPGRIDFYVDNNKTWEYVDERVGSASSYMLLSHQLGGWSGNSNVADSLLPATMHVDYVRVYQKSDDIIPPVE